MKELSIRGLHYFGICYYDNNKYKVIKSFNKEFERFIKIFEMSDSNKFIFHNRYSTSGDWIDENNNQPIALDNIGAIAMNGVLSMSTKKEYEKKYGVKCKCDNDSEIFLRRRILLFPRDRGIWKD